MMCTDVNNDGKVDYMEFTERFHNPAREIGKCCCDVQGCAKI